MARRPPRTRTPRPGNIATFIADVCQQWNNKLVFSVRCPDQDYGDGRYAGELTFLRPNGKRHTCEVQMFGVSLDYAEGGDPPGFAEPRVYVDDSSWVWDFAVPNARAVGLPPPAVGIVAPDAIPGGFQLSHANAAQFLAALCVDLQSFRWSGARSGSGGI